MNKGCLSFVGRSGSDTHEYFKRDLHVIKRVCPSIGLDPIHCSIGLEAARGVRGGVSNFVWRSGLSSACCLLEHSKTYPSLIPSSLSLNTWGGSSEAVKPVLCNIFLHQFSRRKVGKGKKERRKRGSCNFFVCPPLLVNRNSGISVSLAVGAFDKW